MNWKWNTYRKDDNVDWKAVFEEIQRKELIQRFTDILGYIGNHDEAEKVKTYSDSSVHKVGIDLKRNDSERTSSQQEVRFLDIQRTMLVGTLKAPMKRLVNVLHEIAVQQRPL